VGNTSLIQEDRPWAQASDRWHVVRYKEDGTPLLPNALHLVQALSSTYGKTRPPQFVVPSVIGSCACGVRFFV